MKKKVGKRNKRKRRKANSVAKVVEAEAIGPISHWIDYMVCMIY